MPKYYGVIPMEGAYYGGLAYVPGSTGVGLVDQDGVAAHEIGHNLGRGHVDCGNPGGIDYNYPYPGGVIGNVGVDVHGIQLIPASHRDIMSYCWPKWISDYHYVKFLETLTGQGLRSLATQAATAGWIVKGQIDPGGMTGQLSFAEPISSTNVVVPPGQGNYRIELRDTTDVVRFSYAFNPAVIETHDALAKPFHFGFSVPRISNLGTITLWRGTALLATLRAAAAAPAVSAAQGAPKDGNPDAVNVSWAVLSPDGAPPRVTVRYSPDGGQKWQVLAIDPPGSSLDVDTRQLAGTSRGVVEVIATNTTESNARRLELGAVPNKPPRVGIGGGATLQVGSNQAFVLVGVATDLEDGNVPSTSLRWSDSQGRFVGTGETLFFQQGLPMGEYDFTLTAADGAGAQSQTSTRVRSGYQAYLPLALRMRQTASGW